MIVALCMARNEAATIGLVIDHLHAQGVDKVVVEDGHSTDGTYELAVESGAHVTREESRAYNQSERMTGLAAQWCAPDDWVIPFDADEFLYSDDGTIREALTATRAAKCWARMYLHRDWDHRARDPKPLPKVAFRYQPGAVIAFGNHSVDVAGPDEWGVLDLREWQYRSFEHLLAKVEKQRELLAHTPDLDPQYGAHKNRLVGMTVEQLETEWEQMQAGEWVFDPIPCRL